MISLSVPRSDGPRVQGRLGPDLRHQVSPDLILEKVTDAVPGRRQGWQTSPLEGVCPIVYLDALIMKIRDRRTVEAGVLVPLGVDLDGERDVLGLWFQQDRGHEVTGCHVLHRT